MVSVLKTGGSDDHRDVYGGVVDASVASLFMVSYKSRWLYLLPRRYVASMDEQRRCWLKEATHSAKVERASCSQFNYLAR